MRQRLTLIILAVLLLTMSSAWELTGEKSNYWWHVVITVKIDGKYFYESQGQGFDGEYAFTSVILGSLQEDDGDFIFVQAHQENDNLKWKETVHKDASHQTVDRSKTVQPDATLNYVFKKEDDLFFDFDFRPVYAPVKSELYPKPVMRVRLPSSAGDASISTKGGYNKRVVTGSNNMVIKYKTFYTRQFNEYTFKWSWMDDARHRQQHHLVDVHMKINRMTKKK